MHVVAHERGTAALPRQVMLRTWLDRLVADAAATTRDGSPLLADEGAQAIAGRALVEIEVLRHHATRTMSAFLNGGAVGPESSSVKLLMAQAEQTLGADRARGARRRAAPASSGTSGISTRAPRASTAARSRSSATSSPTASSRCPRTERWTSS